MLSCFGPPGQGSAKSITLFTPDRNWVGPLVVQRAGDVLMRAGEQGVLPPRLLCKGRDVGVPFERRIVVTGQLYSSSPGTTKVND